MQDQKLFDILKGLRRRRLALDGTAGLVWGLIAAAACLAAGVWADLVLELPSGLRLTVLVISVGAAIVMVVRSVRSAISRGTPARLARRLDDVCGSGGQIVSGFDLADASRRRSFSHDPVLSAGLARMAVERAWRLASAVQRSAAVPADAVRRSLGSMALFGISVTAFALLLPRLAATEWERFADPFGDHPPFSSVTFSVEPGDAKVVYGSGLEIHATVSGPPVDGVALVMHAPAEPGPGASKGANTTASADDEVVPMFPEPDSRWRVSIANLTRPTTYFVRARSARSRRYSIEVLTVPQIESVQFHVTPPPYTRMAAYDGPLPTGGLSGLPGTEVRVTMRSNRPLSGGSLLYVTGDARHETALASTGGAETVSGTFTISGSGRIEASIVDTAGQRSSDKYSAPVTRLVDERPFVRLVEPRAISYATPTAVIPVVINAEDDYGISRLQLFRSLNDSRYLPGEVQIASQPPKQVFQVVPLPLAAYGIEPGDEIKLFARVEDNDPQAAISSGSSGVIGKGAESSIVLIRIISQEDFDRYRQNRDGLETLMSKYRQARRRMESLADEIAKVQEELRETPEGDEKEAAFRQKLKELAERLQQEAEALHQLAQDRQPFKIDEDMTEQLEQMAQDLERLQKRAQDLAENDAADSEQLERGLQQLADELRERRQQLENQVMQPLEQMAAVVPLVRDESRFVRLYLRQRDLAERLAALKDKDHVDDPALKTRMRDLEDEQRQIRQDLEALLDDIEEHAAKLPEDEEFDELRDSALEFVEALRASGAAEAMTAAENGLAEFSGSRGHTGALEAADILERFLSKAGGMGQQGAGNALGRFSPGLGNSLGQTLQQMMRGMPGSGDGFGGGDGYSESRSTADNVGLYGSNPHQSPAGSEGMTNRQPRDGGPGRGGPGMRSLDSGSEPNAAPGKLHATGGADASIPLRYRRQVGRYFQRVADELGEK